MEDTCLPSAEEKTRGESWCEPLGEAKGCDLALVPSPHWKRPAWPDRGARLPLPFAPTAATPLAGNRFRVGFPWGNQFRLPNPVRSGLQPGHVLPFLSTGEAVPLQEKHPGFGPSSPSKTDHAAVLPVTGQPPAARAPLAPTSREPARPLSEQRFLFRPQAAEGLATGRSVSETLNLHFAWRRADTIWTRACQGRSRFRFQVLASGMRDERGCRFSKDAASFFQNSCQPSANGWQLFWKTV
jgi:hypothetical protein